MSSFAPPFPAPQLPFLGLPVHPSFQLCGSGLWPPSTSISCLRLPPLRLFIPSSTSPSLPPHLHHLFLHLSISSSTSSSSLPPPLQPSSSPSQRHSLSHKAAALCLTRCRRLTLQVLPSSLQVIIQLENALRHPLDPLLASVVITYISSSPPSSHYDSHSPTCLFLSILALFPSPFFSSKPTHHVPTPTCFVTPAHYSSPQYDARPRSRRQPEPPQSHLLQPSHRLLPVRLKLKFRSISSHSIELVSSFV